VIASPEWLARFIATGDEAALPITERLALFHDNAARWSRLAPATPSGEPS